MTRIAILLGLLLSISAYPKGIVVDASVNNLGTSYNTSFPQQTMTDIAYAFRFAITNKTSGTICCNISTPSTSVAPSTDEYCAFANTVKMYDGATANKNVYCRGLTSISTGSFIVEAWGDR